MRIRAQHGTLLVEPGAAYHDPAEEWANAGWVPASLDTELDGILVLHLLNIGHGFKKELKAVRLGRYKHGEYGSAHVTMLEGVSDVTLLEGASAQLGRENSSSC